MSDLDKDFEYAVAKINLKLKEAAVAIKDASALAKTIGLSSLIFDMGTRESLTYLDGEDDDAFDDRVYELENKFSKIDASDLEGALSNGGWSTSGSYC